MKLSTYIKAAREADLDAEQAYLKLRTAPWDETLKIQLKRKTRQANKFHARAVQLADEQHDLIVTQEAQLDQFAQALQEVTK